MATRVRGCGVSVPSGRETLRPCTPASRPVASLASVALCAASASAAGPTGQAVARPNVLLVVGQGTGQVPEGTRVRHASYPSPPCVPQCHCQCPDRPAPAAAVPQVDFVGRELWYSPPLAIHASLAVVSTTALQFQLPSDACVYSPNQALLLTDMYHLHPELRIRAWAGRLVTCDFHGVLAIGFGRMLVPALHPLSRRDLGKCRKWEASNQLVWDRAAEGEVDRCVRNFA